jgi:hypothetical protein
MSDDPLSAEAREYFYMVAKEILQELINSRSGFRFFGKSRGHSPQATSFYEIQEKLDQNGYLLPNEFVSEVRLLFQNARLSPKLKIPLSHDIDELSIKFEQLAGRLPHFLSETERNSAVHRLFELQKYQYLLQKTSHC